MIRIIFFAVLAYFSTGYARASCIELRENSEISVSTASSASGEICITLRDLQPAETYFMVDPSYPGMNSPVSVGYDASLQLSNGSTVYNKNIYSDPDIVKVNLQSHDRVTLRLKKAQKAADYDYTFDIINNREAQGFSIISIAVKATKKSSSGITPPPSGGEGCSYGKGGILICTNPLRVPYSVMSSSNAVMIGDVALSGVGQCNAGNMPPSPAPYPKLGGAQMNMNSILRNESSWRNKMRTMTISHPLVSNALTYQRLYQNHKTGAIFDVKSKGSLWHGNADFGNFLYGSLMYVHGFSETEALRYSAAYQAIQNNENKFTMDSVSQGIYNYVTNSGDGKGDPALVQRGYKYAKEIHSANTVNPKSLSCVDEQTLNQVQTDPEYGSGGFGGGSNGIQVQCELWYFPGGLSNGQYYLETNCQFYQVP